MVANEVRNKTIREVEGRKGKAVEDVVEVVPDSQEGMEGASEEELKGIATEAGVP